MFDLATSTFVVLYAVLWSFMEIEIEGTNGWMYNTPSECAGFAGFTWYHMYMNGIILLTLFAAVRPMSLKGIFVYVYYNILWFTLEDVVWFVYNGVTYGSAPWQSDNTRWISILCLWVSFIVVFVWKEPEKTEKPEKPEQTRFIIIEENPEKPSQWTDMLVHIINLLLLVAANTYITVYAFDSNFGSAFQKNQTFEPRRDYC